ncbi:hypothetical protein Pcinc_010577 [Petrolisthes cinctipes]|uniref:Uncharacterized protein n=1 Tax=Petrolisthes cinctipes TaxID=88211 RepID=A0AAE1G4K5_PETCI|nr:hypothetical protein Pcinc_010577 [Petrolisthes cinctipes]
MHSSTQENVVLVVEPISCLHDEPVTIRVSGLQPKKYITLMTTMKDIRGVHFMSYAHFIANDEGKVDVSRMESQGGHYKGHFPMGLIGGLKPAPSEFKYTRFFKRDVETPNEVKVSVHEGHLSEEDLCPPDPAPHLAWVTHLRHYMAPGVKRIPVRYGKPGDSWNTVRPSWPQGGLPRWLAFFGYDDLPKSLEEFNITYFEEAVEFLLKHEKVLRYGVGVIGTSKGGDLALSMAAFISSVRACVAINGCSGPIGVPMRVRDKLYHNIPNWDASMIRLTDDGVVISQNTSIHPNSFKEMALPIEKSNAAYLFIASGNDQDMKSEMYAHDAYKRLSENYYTRHYEISSHPGAGHILEPPYSPHSWASFQHAQMLVMCWGGTCKYHTLGQQNAWVTTIQFLWHHLVKECDPDSQTEPVLPTYSNDKHLQSNL